MMNSGINFKYLSGCFENRNVAVLDCSKLTNLKELNRNLFKVHVSQFVETLKNVMIKGGVVFINLNDINDNQIEKDLDPDLFVILKNDHILSKLLNPKELKEIILKDDFLDNHPIHDNFGIILFSKFKINENTPEDLITQNIFSRFQFLINPILVDVVAMRFLPAEENN